MTDSVHHIRLLAGLEIEPGQAPTRVLDRHQADTLAGHLAEDLHRVAPEVEQAMLVLGGSLLEPTELIRPGFPAWQGLEELADATLRERGFAPRILAIGAHGNRLPHATLQPPEQAPQGRMLALPMTLICPAEQTEALQKKLEEVLFEQGSIHPPALALLKQAAGLDSVHGQLLTLADLIALQHVQLDAAGLGGFWPVAEQALVEPDSAQSHELPGGVLAHWRPEGSCVDIDFLTLDQHGGPNDVYALWMRAFRTLTALLDSHGIGWQAQPSDPVMYDPESCSMIEAAGECDAANSVTVQQHPDIGLLAWTVVEDGRLLHIYPLSPESTERVMSDLAARGLEHFDQCQQVHSDPATGRLKPASQDEEE